MFYGVLTNFEQLTFNRPQTLPSKSCLVSNSLIRPSIVRNYVIHAAGQHAASVEAPYSLLNQSGISGDSDWLRYVLSIGEVQRAVC